MCCAFLGWSDPTDTRIFSVLGRDWAVAWLLKLRFLSRMGNDVALVL